MALKGNLKDFGITQLLNLINLARKTGTLYLEASQGKATLSFREGKLVYATKEGEEDSLLAILQKSGKLNPEQVRAILQHMAGKSDHDIAITLMNAGTVAQAELIKGLNKYVLDLVYQVFGWTEGKFQFEPAVVPGQDKVTTSIALENVIMEGSRRQKEWERLQEELPDLDISLKFAERPSTPLRNINLSVEEWRVISFINPRNTIRQIAQSNNMSEFQIRKIIYSLIQAGLVEVIRPERPSAPTTPTRATAGDGESSIQLQRPAVKRGLVQKLIDKLKSD